MGKATKSKKKKAGDSNEDIDVSNWEHKRTIATQTDKRSSFDKLKEELLAQKVTNSKLTDELERLGNENYDLREEMKKVKEASEYVADSAKEKLRDFRLKTKTAKDQSEKVSQAVTDIHGEIMKFKEIMEVVKNYMNEKADDNEREAEAKRKQERVRDIKRRSFLTKCKDKLKRLKEQPRSEEEKAKQNDFKPSNTNRVELMKMEKSFRDQLILVKDIISNKEDIQLSKVNELIDKLLIDYDLISKSLENDAEVLDAKEWENLKLKTEIYRKDVKISQSKQLKLNQEIIAKHKQITKNMIDNSDNM